MSKSRARRCQHPFKARSRNIIKTKGNKGAYHNVRVYGCRKCGQELREGA